MEVEVSDSGSSAPNDPKRKRPAKLFHKKSRTGCQQCRSRRVKCNEAKPICNNCERLDLTCVYDRLQLDGTAVSPKPSDGLGQRSRAHETSDPPESEHRRRLELQLYNQFITDTGLSLSVGEDALQSWILPISRLALQSDALLHSMYCVSALHLASRDPINKDHHLDICHTYFNMALREHTVEITKFSIDTLDSILFTSNLIRYFDFVMLQERPLSPYSPPTEWMRVASSSSVIFEKAVELSRDAPDSLSRMLFSRCDFFEAGARHEYGQGLVHLLERQKYYQLTEPWSPEIQEAYQSTIRYIGFIWSAMNHNEKPSRVAKKLILFAQMVDKHFITLLEEQRPRALVILAHYFALLSMIRGIWWNNGIGEREVRAIAGAMPDEWRGMMSWPLSIVEQQMVFTGEV